MHSLYKYSASPTAVASKLFLPKNAIHVLGLYTWGDSWLGSHQGDNRKCANHSAECGKHLTEYSIAKIPQAYLPLLEN